MAAATAAMLVGGRTLEQRRLLRLADRAREGHESEHADRYVETGGAAGTRGHDRRRVGQAVLDGRRAVELAETDADEILTAALAAYARALFFAGELDEASAAAVRALEHPDIERHVPSLVVARATLALVAVERGTARVGTRPRREGEGGGRAGSGRAAAGSAPTLPPPLGSVLAAEGNLVEAEHELASAERFFT